jgi:isopenicillin-N epimerase
MSASTTDSAPNAWRHLWSLDPDVTYLNHGSFGPSPRVVRAAQQGWIDRLERNPMDFFMRQFDRHLEKAHERLATFVGTRAMHLLFVDNATFGMNVVARTIPLKAGDEILMTDHEYGAVIRIWRQRCQSTGAALVVRKLPQPLETADGVVEALFAGATSRTKLLVVSHVTSKTAVILPLQKICARARELGIPVCVDGPHAPAMVPVAIDRLGCDFYAASCHKWLSAPFGSGFLYVHPRWQQSAQPSIVSWGRTLSGHSSGWMDGFLWSGTRDPSAFLTVPAAIEFLESFLGGEPGESGGETTSATAERGIQVFRDWGHRLARQAREQISKLTRLEPLVPDSPEWYGTMISLPLPESVPEAPAEYMHPLQEALWDRFRIEIPVVNWQGRRYLRVSCHLYNSAADIDRLSGALRTLL